MTKLKVLVMISDKSSVILRSALPAFPYHRTITNWEKGESKHALPQKQMQVSIQDFSNCCSYCVTGQCNALGGKDVRVLLHTQAHRQL